MHALAATALAQQIGEPFEAAGKDQHERDDHADADEQER
jgi:hypothetical protein